MFKTGGVAISILKNRSLIPVGPHHDLSSPTVAQHAYLIIYAQPAISTVFSCPAASMSVLNKKHERATTENM